MAKISVREALRSALREELALNEAVYIIGEEVGEYQGAYKVTEGLLQEFGSRRVIDAPISEHGFTGLAIGSAFAGLVPVVEFMSFNFSMQAIDQIVNSAAKTRYMSGGQVSCPIVFRGPNGSASQVAAQHSQCYASWYAHVPGLKVVAPYSVLDHKGLLKAAIRDPNPVIFLENEILYGFSQEIDSAALEENCVVEIGKSNIIKIGTDATIVAFSICVRYALEAAKILEDEYGLSIEVIDLRTLRPMDLSTIVRSLKKTGRLVTVEEGWPFAGIGAEISASIMQNAFDYLDAPVFRVSAKDVPTPYASNLEALVIPKTADVVDAVKVVCNIVK